MCWDKPAIIALDGDACIAGINWSEDMDDLAVDVRFAWCSPLHPSAFAQLLSRFRSKVRETKCTEIRFSCHEGNEAMAKAVRVLRLTPVSYSYRIPISTIAQGARA